MTATDTDHQTVRVDASAAGSRDRLRHYAGRARTWGVLLKGSIHIRYWLANAVCGLLPTYFSALVRARVYRLIGFPIAPTTSIGGNIRLTGAETGFYENLVTAPRAVIANGVTINIDGRVTIGRCAGIGPDVKIYTATHRIGPGSNRLGDGYALPVTIEDGAWVRAGALIVPGVTIGRGAIVAAGAVVLHDVPPNTYVEGNPAKVIRKLGWADR
jgi:acetyltransferase-like isoleucine patch superfamily enzyme